MYGETLMTTPPCNSPHGTTRSTHPRRRPPASPTPGSSSSLEPAPDTFSLGRGMAMRQTCASGGKQRSARGRRASEGCGGLLRERLGPSRRFGAKHDGRGERGTRVASVPVPVSHHPLELKLENLILLTLTPHRHETQTSCARGPSLQDRDWGRVWRAADSHHPFSNTVSHLLTNHDVTSRPGGDVYGETLMTTHSHI